MNLWKTLALLGVFVALLLYVRKYEDTTPPDFESDRMLVEQLGFKAPDEIVEVTVEGQNGTFTLVRDTSDPDQAWDAGEAWRITSPVDEPGDSTVIGSYVRTLLTTKAQQEYDAKSLAESGFDPSSASLDKPAGALTLKDRNGRAATMNFGQPNPADDGYYAQPKDGDKLLIFAKFYATSNVVEKQLGDLRDKTLLSFLTTDVDKLTLAYPAETIRLEKSGDNWVIKGEKELPADRTAIDSMLSVISGARIDSFADSNPTDLTGYGLAEPRIQVTLSLGEKGEKGLLIGDSIIEEQAEPDPMSGGAPPEPKEQLYVQRKGGKEVVLIPGHVYDSLLKDVYDLRDKTVLAMAEQDVTKLTYTLDNETVSAEKASAASQPGQGKLDWELLEPEKLKADRDVIEGIITNLNLLRATKFVDAPEDLAPYGLAEPRGRIVVSEVKQEKPALLIGSEDDAGLWVMREGSDTVMQVRASILEDLEFKVARLRDLLVMDLDRTKVKSIGLRQGSGDLVELQADGANAWKLVKPEEKEADAGTVGQILTRLEDLRGDEYIAEKADDLKPYGLDKPDLVVTVVMEDGSKKTVYLAEDPAGSLSVYLKRASDSTVYRSDTIAIITDLRKGPDDFEPFEEPPMPDFGGMPPF